MELCPSCPALSASWPLMVDILLFLLFPHHLLLLLLLHLPLPLFCSAWEGWWEATQGGRNVMRPIFAPTWLNIIITVINTKIKAHISNVAHISFHEELLLSSLAKKISAWWFSILFSSWHITWRNINSYLKQNNLLVRTKVWLPLMPLYTSVCTWTIGIVMSHVPTSKPKGPKI